MNNVPSQLISGNQLPLPPGFSREVTPHQSSANLSEVAHTDVPVQTTEAALGVDSLRGFAARREAGNPGYGELAASREAYLGGPLGSYSAGLSSAGLRPAESTAATQTTEYAEGGLHQTFLGSQKRAEQARRQG